MFELKIGDGIVKLKWGTYAMKLLCDRAGKTLDEFFAMLARMADNPTQQEAFEMVQLFLHAGYQYANGVKASEQQVCEWIDSLGGIVSVNNGQLVDYINYVVKLTINGVTPLPNDSEGIEKKKEE